MKPRWGNEDWGGFNWGKKPSKEWWLWAAVLVVLLLCLTQC